MRGPGGTRLARFLPIAGWLPEYDRTTLTSDLVAAAIVTIMLVPQSLAYALLAGLPPQMGLYASILPLALYALFGTSRTLSVGPVAVISLMTASAASAVAVPGSPEYIAAAIVLALLSGLMLIAMGLLRLGFIANLLSHPVISGFILASALLIVLSQLKHLLGITSAGDTAPELILSLARGLPSSNVPTLAVGAGTLAFLYWVRRGLKPLLMRFGMAARPADLLAKAGPMLAVAASTLLVATLALEEAGVAVLGVVPRGLPPLTVPLLDLELWSALLVPAVLIGLIGFVESVSVAQTLAAKRRQRIEPDSELIALGTANVAASFSGGLPVTGGFARSVVNFDAGAETPLAGAFTAAGIALGVLFLTPLLYFLPLAVLAATIIVAVLSLVDLRAVREVWRYSKSDFAALAGTVLITLLAGIEAGVVAGVAVSLVLLLWRASRPHAAVVGLVPGTQHFRNVLRHEVITSSNMVTLRVDESLTFINARWLEDRVLALVAERPQLEHVVLMCSAVNTIDGSALETLQMLNHRLRAAGVQLHLSEVKGPVMDRLGRSHLLEELTGEVFLSQYDAFERLSGLRPLPAEPAA